MKEVPEPQLAQSVVVVIERAAIDADRDAATCFDHARDRCYAGAQMQIRTGINGDGDAALRQQFEFVRSSPDAMRQRESRRQQTERDRGV